MRARDVHDYSQSGPGATTEDKLGRMGGIHRDKMNSMFDTRAKDTENHQRNLLESIENNRKKYDRQLFSDWVIKVYRKCSEDCLRPPSLHTQEGFKLMDEEKRCATNCIRKYERGYKLYSNMEDQIFNSYMESQNVDPEQFYAQVNNMTPK